MPTLVARPESAFVPDIELPMTPYELAQGGQLYGENCARCHGGRGASMGAMPNLQESNQAIHEAFEQIVREGLFETRGMPAFGERLSSNEVRLIQAYIVSEAKKTIEGSTG